MPRVSNALWDAVTEFLIDIQTALPRLFSGLIFLVVAAVIITAIRFILGRFLRRIYPEEQRLIANLAMLLVTIGLWFSAGLVLLSILGMGAVAASLGTATGFIALGVSYALSDMIADTVAGLYLLRDPDFNPGDTVTTADVTGTVQAIGLRKSRLQLDDGDIIVLANQAVESKWRLETG